MMLPLHAQNEGLCDTALIFGGKAQGRLHSNIAQVQTFPSLRIQIFSTTAQWE